MARTVESKAMPCTPTSFFLPTMVVVTIVPWPSVSMSAAERVDALMSMPAGASWPASSLMLVSTFESMTATMMPLPVAPAA
jgi:hypothetical protein